MKTVYFRTKHGKEVEFSARGRRKPSVIENAMEKAVLDSTTASLLLTKLGIPVILTDDFGAEIKTTLTRLPWKLGHGAWVCGVEGKSGGYDCGRIRPV